MYDVAVIGAGVTGSMTARLLSFTGLKTIVLEKGDDLASGASRANSAVVHAGYDPVPGTLKAKLNVRGAQLMEQTCRELDVPYKPMPSLVVAFNEKQTETLRALLERGEKNGVKVAQKEGNPDSGWMILATNELIVHLFTDVNRKEFDLEGLLAKLKTKTMEAADFALPNA